MPQIPETPIDWAGLLPEFLQTPARAVGRTLSELTRPVAYAQGYGPDMVTLADLADIPESKVGVALTLAGMVPGGKVVKAAKRIKPQVSEAVRRAEELLKGIDPAEEKILYHSGTADIDEAIRKNWLQPQQGEWVREVLAGATDDPEHAAELAKSGVVYMSDAPTWVKAKVARAAGKHAQERTDTDAAQPRQPSSHRPPNTA